MGVGNPALVFRTGWMLEQEFIGEYIVYASFYGQFALLFA